MGGEQVPGTRGAGVGRANPGPWLASWFLTLAADRGQLAAGPGLQVERAELIDAEDHLRVAGIRGHVAVRDRVLALDLCLLRRVVRSL